MNDQSILMTAKPKPLQRWWLRARTCPKAIQLNHDGVPPVVELYVPFWGWPFEVAHRLIFGRAKLTAIQQ